MAASDTTWPRGSVESIILPAPALTVVAAGDSGGASLGSGAAWHIAWICDSASNSAIGASIRIPPAWATVDVIVAWYNNGAGSGAVNLRLIHDAYGAGDTVTAAAETAITPTAGAEDVAQVDTLKSGLAVTAGEELMLVMQRRPVEASDTLGNSIAVSHLVVSRAS